MDDSRMFRISFVGGLLIFSTIFFYWILGGDLLELINDMKEYTDLMSFIIPLIIATPVLGFIVSTISVGTVQLFYGVKIHFILPSTVSDFNLLRKLANSDKVDKILDGFQIFKNIFTDKRCSFCKKNRKKVKEIYYIFCLMAQLHSNEMVTKFIARRWNIFWTHINNIFAIIFGLFLAVVFAYPFYGFEFFSKKMLLLLPIILYLVFGYFLLKRNREEAINIEYLLLADSIKDKLTHSSELF